MSYLPAKRKPKRSGIVRAPRRIFQGHRAHVRRHMCSIPNCPYQDDPIEFAHIGPVGTSGEAMKCPDWFGISWCRTHHHLAHLRGHETMCREAGTTMDAQRAIAIRFARTTTDKAMRREIELWHVDLNTGAMASSREVLFG